MPSHVFLSEKNNKVDDNRDNAEKINKTPKILVMSWCLYNVKEIIFKKKMMIWSNYLIFLIAFRWNTERMLAQVPFFINFDLSYYI